MFIGVVRYKDSLRSLLTEKITVLDTDDGTVEVVNTADIKGIDIDNITSNYTRCISCRLLLLLKKNNIDNDCFKVGAEQLQYRGWNIGFGEHRIWRVNDRVLNTKRFPDCSIYDVSYMFEFKDYLVFRLFTPGSAIWRTLVLKPDGFAAYWTRGAKKIIGDSALAMKIDMLSEV